MAKEKMKKQDEIPATVLSIVNSSAVGPERKCPDKAVLALEMLSTGHQWKEVREETGLSFDQIARLRARHKTAIDERRAQLASDGFEMAEGLRLLVKQKMATLADDEEALAKVPLRDLALSYGISVDKGMQAMGENRTIIEHVTRKPSIADAQAAIEEARKLLQKEAIPVEAKSIA